MFLAETDDARCRFGGKQAKGKEPSNIRVIGIYILPKEFIGYLKRIEEKMYAFEEALDLYIKEKGSGLAINVEQEVPSLKYPWDLLKITKSAAGKSGLQMQNITLNGDYLVDNLLNVSTGVSFTYSSFNRVFFMNSTGDALYIASNFFSVDFDRG